MPSELKSETARANGAKSRGPTTAAGREKSSRNSLRHGFTSRSTIVLECENPEEFKEMLADYKATYRPDNAAESDLVDQMVAARCRIRRIWTFETTLLHNEIRRKTSPPAPHPASSPCTTVPDVPSANSSSGESRLRDRPSQPLTN